MKLLFSLLFCLLQLKNFAQQNTSPIQWQNIAHIDSLKNTLIFIDMYADWCGWCKQLDNTTFKNTNFITYLNTHYTSFKFNGEQKDPIYFDNKNFTYLPQHNIHELALYFSNGTPSYPMTIILHPKKKQIFTFPGYKTAQDFEMILKYLAESNDISANTFQDYSKNFKHQW